MTDEQIKHQPVESARDPYIQVKTNILENILLNKNSTIPLNLVDNQIIEYYGRGQNNCNATFKYGDKFYRFNYETCYDYQQDKELINFCEADNFGFVDCIEVKPIQKTKTFYLKEFSGRI